MCFWKSLFTFLNESLERRCKVLHMCWTRMHPYYVERHTSMHIFWARGPINYTIIWHPWFSPNRSVLWLAAEGQFLEQILWLEVGSQGQDIDRLALGLANVILFFILTIRLFRAIWVKNLFRVLVSAIRSHCGITISLLWYSANLKVVR